MSKKYDGCSGYMSKMWNKCTDGPPPWEGCCDAHDRDYAVGGTVEDRKESDIRLAKCVTDGGWPKMAVAMYYAVRLGGAPWMQIPGVSWGFGGERFYYDD